MQTFLDKVLVMLRHHREASGLSQADVAQKLGIGLRSYQRYESGETIPTIDLFFALSKILNFELKDFFAPEVLKNTFTGLTWFEGKDEQQFLQDPVVEKSRLQKIFDLISKKDLKSIRDVAEFKNSSSPLVVAGLKMSVLNPMAVRLMGLSSDSLPTNSWQKDPRKTGTLWAILMDHKKICFSHESSYELPLGKCLLKSKNIFGSFERNYLILSTFDLESQK